VCLRRKCSSVGLGASRIDTGSQVCRGLVRMTRIERQRRGKGRRHVRHML